MSNKTSNAASLTTTRVSSYHFRQTNPTVVNHVITGFKPENDEDLPGGGEFYCQFCCRHFGNGTIMQGHLKTRHHKRTVRKIAKTAENPYTQMHADAAVGLSTESYDRKKL